MLFVRLIAASQAGGCHFILHGLASAPGIGLRVQVGQITELARREEGAANVAYGTLDPAFFIAVFQGEWPMLSPRRRPLAH